MRVRESVDSRHWQSTKITTATTASASLLLIQLRFCATSGDAVPVALMRRLRLLRLRARHVTWSM